MFADLKGYIKHINERNENKRLTEIYTGAINAMNSAKTEADFKAAAHAFQSIADYKDSKEKAKECLEKAEAARKDAIFADGKSKMTGEVAQSYKNAISIFKTIPDWKNSAELILQCEQKITDINVKAEYEAEEKRIETQKSKEKSRKIAAVVVPLVAGVIITSFIFNIVAMPKIKYKKATELLKKENYSEAYSILEKLNKNDEIINNKCERAYKEFKCGNKTSAYALLIGSDSNYLTKILRNFLSTKVSAGDGHTVGLKTDGTVIAVGDVFGKIDMKNWENIVAVSAYNYHTVGLKSDGSVVATGGENDERYNVRKWENIVEVETAWLHTVGLKADGTVVSTKCAENFYDYGQCDVSEWKDIVKISTSWLHTVGLKADGTVIATGYNAYGQCDVNKMEKIVDISAGSDHTVGLKSDGTVVAVGTNRYGQCNVSGWKDIVAISAGDGYTIGLKSDGTVVAVGRNNYGQCNIEKWKEIVEISAGKNYTIGLRSDGTVVAAGENSSGQCDVSDWKDIKIPNTNLK